MKARRKGDPIRNLGRWRPAKGERTAKTGTHAARCTLTFEIGLFDEIDMHAAARNTNFAQQVRELCREALAIRKKGENP